MSNISVGAHVVAVLLALLQCGLAAVLAYRLYLLSQTYKGVDPHRRTTTVNILKVHRTCIFIMTALQCVRCIDPFCTLDIWPYFFNRSLQLSVTITIYFQYSSTTYIVMDTLYACALKRTPGWLAIVVSILPVSEFLVGFGMLAAEYLVAQQWVSAVVSFYVVLMLAVNMTTYNVSGAILMRILRNHQTGVYTGEDISGSKSASPFNVVIAKTKRSMAMLTLPSLAALVLFFILGVAACNTRPMIPFNVNNLPWSVFTTLYIQLILGLLFTRVAWVSKTALEAEIFGKTHSKESDTAPSASEGSPAASPAQPKRNSRTGRPKSRADLKERALRMSQSPKPRNSEGASPPSSRPEQEASPVQEESEIAQGALVPVGPDIV